MNKFYKSFIAGIFFTSLFFLIFHFALLKVGEIDIDNVVNMQLTHQKIFFLSGINQQFQSYKVVLQGKVKPNVIVIGSSRSMQLRDKFFNNSFVNMGGSVQNLQDLEDVLNTLGRDKNHLNKFKLTLLYFDYWWVDSRNIPSHEIHQPDFPKLISPSLLLTSIKLFITKGNWFYKSFLSSNMGIVGITQNTGFASDGSRHEISLVTNKYTYSDYAFEDSVRRVLKNTAPFYDIKKNTNLEIDRACTLINRISAISQQAVVVFPPFAPQVIDAMSQVGLKNDIFKIYTEIAKCSNYQVLDYSDGRQFNQCEFIDGFHAGDVANARMLLNSKNEFLQKNLNLPFLSQFIHKFKGNAGGYTQEFYKTGPEPDFLRLNCVK